MAGDNLVMALEVLQRELSELYKEDGLSPVVRWRLLEMRTQVIRLLAEREGVVIRDRSICRQ